MTNHEAQHEQLQGPVLRLYRGLSRAYKPGPFDKVQAMQGTNFTDCPMAALTYARGRHGVLLVVDVPGDLGVGPRVFAHSQALTARLPRRMPTMERFPGRERAP
jgi:hypothetical protein